MRHINIPVFIPHLGCPHTCVFCNQRTISGHTCFDPSSVRTEIERALSTIEPDTDVEIAFFGGSFTGIDRGEMIYLLDTAQSFIDGGRVASIRLSTRPDYIDGEILEILGRYGVKHVELGIQSLSDKVLAASERGHSSEQAIRACRLIKEAGFSLVGQMMIGLPESDEESEIATAEGICSAGADAARIYPTVVLRGTALAGMTDLKKYKPLTNAEAAERSANVLEVFASHGLPVIRIGLCASDGLGEDVYAGEYHAAIGELAEGELFLRHVERALDGMSLSGQTLTIECPRGCTSKVVGQNRRNKLKLMSKYNIKKMKIIETDTIKGYNIKIRLDTPEA